MRSLSELPFCAYPRRPSLPLSSWSLVNPRVALRGYSLESALAGSIPAHTSQGPERAGEFVEAYGDFFLPSLLAFGDPLEFFVVRNSSTSTVPLDLLPGESLLLVARG